MLSNSDRYVTRRAMTTPAKGVHASPDATRLDAWASNGTDAPHQSVCHRRATHSLPASQRHDQTQQVLAIFPSLT